MCIKKLENIFCKKLEIFYKKLGIIIKKLGNILQKVWEKNYKKVWEKFGKYFLILENILGGDLKK